MKNKGRSVPSRTILVACASVRYGTVVCISPLQQLPDCTRVFEGFQSSPKFDSAQQPHRLTAYTYKPLSAMSATESRKRSLPPSESLSQARVKYQRRHNNQSGPNTTSSRGPTDDASSGRKEHESFAREQTRINQIQEAEQMREWVAKEDDFVLKQAKKKAHIRVKEGRAKTIDWLAVTLGVLDPNKDLLEDDEVEEDTEVIDPSGVFEGLSLSQLQELGKDIDTYLSLEMNDQNRRYWGALRVIGQDYQTKLAPAVSHGRSAKSVSADVDRLLSPKTLAQLEGLEKQISMKLQSNDPIDVEYWESLLESVAVYKARAELNVLYKSIIKSRIESFRHEEAAEAIDLRRKLALVLGEADQPVRGEAPPFPYCRSFDPEPMLRLRPEHKGIDVVEESAFMDRNAAERRRILKLGYVPPRHAQVNKASQLATPKASEVSTSEGARFAPVIGDDFSSATTALYEREVARGVQEDEEIFAGEEEVSTRSKPQWATKYRPRKPRYFNRVQMGYEWNKYNQTHYDHDNPPPKVVQGYKFNIFYPDLIDKSKAPTYRIERENGRKRGETFAPAGEEDTCLIRFISGPPYEDLAFRIVDKEWDFSAKRERGFRSSFDKVRMDAFIAKVGFFLT